MENRKMEIIGQLMEELQEMMGPSSDDLGSRLGRVSPPPEVSMESEEEMPEEFGSPDEKLKSRIMKMRG